MVRSGAAGGGDVDVEYFASAEDKAAGKKSKGRFTSKNSATILEIKDKPEPPKPVSTVYCAIATEGQGLFVNVRATPSLDARQVAGDLESTSAGTIITVDERRRITTPAQGPAFALPEPARQR